jgi:hypothetical protein
MCSLVLLAMLRCALVVMLAPRLPWQPQQAALPRCSTRHLP